MSDIVKYSPPGGPIKYAPGRKQFNKMWFGAQGAGKTGDLILLNLKYVEFNPHKRSLFILPDDNEAKFDPVPEIEVWEIPTFTGIKKLFAGKKTLEWIRNYFIPDPFKLSKEQREYLKKNPRRFDGIINLDDPGTYIGSRPEDLYELFSRRRQLNADFVSTFPGVRKKAPPGYYGYATHIRLYETTDSIKYLLEEIAEDKREELLEMYRRVQAQAKIDQYHWEELIIREIRDRVR